MKSNSTKTFLSIIAVVLGFGLVFLLSNFIETVRPPLPEQYEDEDLALQSSKIKGYSLGFEGLIADWYWMQSLQYIGDKLAKSKETTIDLGNLTSLNPRLLYPMLNTATDLDPQFMVAYSYGAVVLPAINPEQAILIAEKGIANNPNEWRLYQHLGYIHWRLGNFQKAAEVYRNGGKINGAPAFFQMMAAQMEGKGSSRSTARSMYEQMFKESQDSQTKEFAELRLMQLDWLDQRDAIRIALQTFKEKNNRCANNWSEIFPLLRTVKLPNDKDFSIDRANNLVDPSGAPYLLEKQNCEVILDSKNSKIPPE